MNDVVYLIEDTNGITKIGISSNIALRFSQLRASSPTKLRLRYVMECPSREIAKNIERVLHNYYAKHRTNGEWFKVTAAKIVGDIEYLYSLKPHLEDEPLRNYPDSDLLRFEPVTLLPKLHREAKHG